MRSENLQVQDCSHSTPSLAAPPPILTPTARHAPAVTPTDGLVPLSDDRTLRAGPTSCWSRRFALRPRLVPRVGSSSTRSAARTTTLTRTGPESMVRRRGLATPINGCKTAATTTTTSTRRRSQDSPPSATTISTASTTTACWTRRTSVARHLDAQFPAV